MLFMHIGPHKTGTSYIQNRLYSARSELRDLGFAYMPEGIKNWSRHRAHHDLAHNADAYLSDGEAQNKTLRSVAGKGKYSDQTIVLSAEGFRSWKSGQFLRLSSILGKERLKVAYFIRDPFDVYYSYWSEEVKQGYSRSLPERCSMDFLQPMQSRILNPSLDIARIARTEGIEVDVYLYDAIRANGQDVCDSMLEHSLGISISAPTSKKRVNERIPIELTEFLRLLTMRHANGERHIRSDLRIAFMQAISAGERKKIVQLVKNAGSNARRQIILDRECKFYEQLEMHLTRHFGERIRTQHEGDTLLPRGKSRWIYYQGEMLMDNPPIVDELNRVYDRIKDKAVLQNRD